MLQSACKSHQNKPGRASDAEAGACRRAPGRRPAPGGGGGVRTAGLHAPSRALNQRCSSSLRRGRGFVLGPGLGIRDARREAGSRSSKMLREARADPRGAGPPCPAGPRSGCVWVWGPRRGSGSSGAEFPALPEGEGPGPPATEARKGWGKWGPSTRGSAAAGG